jgi:predicted acyl esterase
VDALMATGQAEWNGDPKAYVTGKFDRRFLATWISPPGARRIPRLRLTATSVDRAATLVAYLFDLARDGTARIITHEPYTLTTPETGQGTTVTWQLQASAYDVAEDHRVMLVVKSKDHLYSDANSPYSTLQISSVGGSEACLELPLG